MSNVTEEIVRWMRSHCGQIPASVELLKDSPILDEGWLDSLQTMQLVTHLENRFAFKLPIEEMIPENFETPDRLGVMVWRLLQK
jgi:acyl carrier protein